MRIIPNDAYMSHGELGPENVAFLCLRVVHGSVFFTGLASVSEPTFAIAISFPGHTRWALVCEWYYAMFLARILSLGTRALAWIGVIRTPHLLVILNQAANVRRHGLGLRKSSDKRVFTILLTRVMYTCVESERCLRMLSTVLEYFLKESIPHTLPLGWRNSLKVVGTAKVTKSVGLHF